MYGNKDAAELPAASSTVHIYFITNYLTFLNFSEGAPQTGHLSGALFSWI